MTTEPICGYLQEITNRASDWNLAFHLRHGFLASYDAGDDLDEVRRTFLDQQIEVSKERGHQLWGKEAEAVGEKMSMLRQTQWLAMCIVLTGQCRSIGVIGCWSRRRSRQRSLWSR